MGVCSSKGQIKKSVTSPQQSPSRQSRVPASPPKFPPDERPSTVEDLPTKSKDDEHQLFFPHEAETPEALSARSSTDDQNSTEWETQASAAFESSEDHRTLKSLNISMEPGSLQDDFHDARDKFGESLPDCHPLNSETNPLHETNLVKDGMGPSTSKSFTGTEEVKEKTFVVNKEISLLEKISSEDQEPIKAAKVYTLPIKQSGISIIERKDDMLVTGRASTAQNTPARLQEMQTGKAVATMAISAHPGKDSVEKKTPINGISDEDEALEHPHATTTDQTVQEENQEGQTKSKKTVEQTALIHENNKDSDACTATRENAKTVEQTASVGDEQHRSETAAAIVVATEIYKTHATRGWEKSINRSASIEEQPAEFDTNPTNDSTIKNNTVANAQTTSIEAAEQGFRSFRSQKSSSEAETEPNIKEEIAQPQTSPSTEALQETNDDSQATVLQTELNLQEQDVRNSHSNEYHEEERASAIMEQYTEVELAIDSKHLQETKGENSQAPMPDAELDLQIQDQHNHIIEEERNFNHDNQEEKSGMQGADPTTVNSEKICPDLNYLSDDAKAVEQTASIEDHHKQSHPAAPNPTGELEPVEILATREEVKTVEQTVPIQEHRKRWDPAVPTSNTVTESTETLSTRDNVQPVEQTASIEEKHQVSETTPAASVATEIAETPATRDDPKIVKNSIPIQEQNGESETVPTTNSTLEAAENFVMKEGKRENIDADKLQTVSSQALEEWCEQPKTAPVTTAATEVIKTLHTRDNVQTEDPTIPTKEQSKEIDTISSNETTAKTDTPSANKEIKETKVLELENSNVENVKEPENTGIDQEQTILSLASKQQCEEPHIPPASSAAMEVAENVPTWEDPQKAVSTVPTGEEHESENNNEKTPATDATTEVDVIDINPITEHKVMDLESSKVEYVEEPENRYVCERQSDLPLALNEQGEESETAPSTTPATEIVEKLPTKSDAQIADTTVLIEESDKIPAADATTGADVIVNDVVTEDEKVVQLESRHAENEEERENTDVAAQQTVLSPALEEEHEESHTFPAINASTEVSETLPTREDTETTDPKILTGEQHEASQTFPATKSSVEVSEMPTIREVAGTTHPKVPTEKHHEESDATPGTDATIEVDVTSFGAVTEDEVVNLENSNVENAEELKNKVADEQQSVFPPSLQEQGKESETAPNTNAAAEIADNNPTRVTQDEVVNLESSNVENAEELKNKLADKEQSVCPLALERGEESEKAPNTNAALELAENHPTRVTEDEVVNLESSNVENAEELKNEVADEQQSVCPLAVEEQGEASETAPNTNAATEIAEKYPTRITDDEVVNLERSNVENAEEIKNKVADEQQSVCPLSFEEQGKESEAAPNTNAATEIAENNPIRVTEDEVVNLESSNVENAEELKNKLADKQQSVCPLALERGEESEKAPNTTTASELSENHPTRVTEDEVVNLESSNVENADELENEVADEHQTVCPLVVEEQSEASETAPNTNAATEIAEKYPTRVTDDEVGNLESSNVENAEELKNKVSDKQQSLSPLALEEQGEESETAPNTNAATEIAEKHPTRGSAQTADSTVPFKEQHTESDKSPHIIATREVEVQTTDAITENVEIEELENCNVEHTEEPEEYEESEKGQPTIRGTDIVENLPSWESVQTPEPRVSTEEQHREYDTTPATNETTENINVRGVKSSIVENEEKSERAVADQQQTVTSPAIGEHLDESATNATEQQTVMTVSLEEQHEESHRSSATNATTVLETLTTRPDEITTDPMEPKEGQHQESGGNPAIDATTKIDVLPIEALIKDKIEKLESSNVENAVEPESRDDDGQQSVSLSFLEENSEESETGPPTNATTGIPENYSPRDDAQAGDPALPSEDQHIETNKAPDGIATKELDVLAIDSITEAVKVEELVSINVENPAEPENINADKQQRVSSKVLEEESEESGTVQTTNTATNVIEKVHTMDSAQSADSIGPTSEQHKDSDTTAPADETTEANVVTLDTLKEDVQVEELESSNVENAVESARTQSDKQATGSSPALEEDLEQSTSAPATSASTKIDETLLTRDHTQTTGLTIPAAEQYEKSDATPAPDSMTEAYVPLNAAITGGVKVKELKSNNVENVEESEITEADPQEAVLSSAVEEHVGESDTDPAINKATKTVETLVTRDEKQTTEQAVQTEEPHRVSDATPATDTPTEEDAVPINAIPGDVKAGAPYVGEIESSNLDNAVESERTDPVQQQSVSSPAVEEHLEESTTAPPTNSSTEIAEILLTRGDPQTTGLALPAEEEYEKLDPTPSSNSMTEADVPLTNTITGDMKDRELKRTNVQNAEESESTEADQKAAVLSPSLEEHLGESDTDPASNKATEIVETPLTRDERQTSEQPAQTEELQRELDATTVTDTPAEEDAVPIIPIPGGVKAGAPNVGELERSNVENAVETESRDDDGQQSVSLSFLEENSEESETGPPTNATTGIPENYSPRDDAQAADPALPSQEQHIETNKAPDGIATKELDVLAIDSITEAVKVEELVSINVENPAEPENINADKQQRVSSKVLEEESEESGTVQTTNTAINVIEKVHTMDSAQSADSIGPTSEQHKDSDTTAPADETTEANVVTLDALKEDVQVEELESSNVENAVESARTQSDKQTTGSSPALEEDLEQSTSAPATSSSTKIAETLLTRDHTQTTGLTLPAAEQYEKSDATPAPDSMTEAYVPLNAAITGGMKVKELKSNNVENVEQSEITEADPQEAVLSSAVEEHVGESDTDPATKTVETLVTRDERQTTEQPVQTEEPHRVSDATPATDTPTEEDAVPINAISGDVKAGAPYVGEIESSNLDNAVESERTDPVQQQSVSSPAVEEHLEESTTAPATNSSTEIAEILLTRDNTQTTGLTLPAEEEYEKSDPTPSSNSMTEADVPLANTITGDVKDRELKRTNVQNAEESESTEADQKAAVLSPSLEEHLGESDTDPASNKATEIVETPLTRDERQTTEQPAQTEEPQRELDATTVTDTPAEEDAVPIIPIPGGVKAGALNVGELERSNVENAVESARTDPDQQLTVSSPAIEAQLEESATAPANNVSIEIAETLLTRGDPQREGLIVPAEEQHQKSDATPVPDAMTEANVLLINAITEDLMVKELKSSNVQNVEALESTDAVQQEAVLSPPVEKHLQESNIDPAISQTTEIVESLLTRDDRQTTEQAAQTEKEHKESDKTVATDTPTEVDAVVTDAILDGTRALQSSNDENIVKPESTIDDQQTILSPALDQQQEQTEITPAINASTEMVETLPTGDNTQTREPTIPAEAQHMEVSTKVSMDTTIKGEIPATNAVVENMKSVELGSSNVENLDDPESIDANKQAAVLSQALCACTEETESEKHKEYENSNEVSPNRENTDREIQHDATKGTEVEVNGSTIPEEIDHDMANSVKEGDARQKTIEVHHAIVDTIDSNSINKAKAEFEHAEDNKDTIPGPTTEA